MVSQKKSRKIPTRKLLPLLFASRAIDTAKEQLRATPAPDTPGTSNGPQDPAVRVCAWGECGKQLTDDDAAKNRCGRCKQAFYCGTSARAARAMKLFQQWSRHPVGPAARERHAMACARARACGAAGGYALAATLPVTTVIDCCWSNAILVHQGAPARKDTGAAAGTRHQPFNSNRMGVGSVSPAHLRTRPTWAFST